MSRIDGVFAALRQRGRKALIPYLTAGDPHADGTVAIMRAMAAAGADIIELGIPFSDPMADGPVIQKASERALARGIGLTEVLAMVRAFRERDDRTPLVLMGYANPIERYGVDRFVADAKDAGVDGVLVVDYPPEECADFAAALRHASIDPIFLIAPTSSAKAVMLRMWLRIRVTSLKRTRMYCARGGAVMPSSCSTPSAKACSWHIGET